MEFAVATSTVTTFAEELFGNTLSLVFSMITALWPLLLTVVFVYGAIRIVKKLIGAGRS